MSRDMTIDRDREREGNGGARGDRDQPGTVSVLPSGLASPRQAGADARDGVALDHTSRAEGDENDDRTSTMTRVKAARLVMARTLRLLPLVLYHWRLTVAFGPATKLAAGTSSTTIAPAAITESRPMLTPGRMVAPAPIADVCHRRGSAPRSGRGVVVHGSTG